MRPPCALRIRTRYAMVSNECSTTRPLSRSWLVGAAHVRDAPALSRIQAVAAAAGASVGYAVARGRSVRSTAAVTRQPFMAVRTSLRRPKNAVSLVPVPGGPTPNSMGLPKPLSSQRLKRSKGAMMSSMEPQHISRQAVRIVEAVCANSGAGAEVRVSITTNESSGDSWIDLRIGVAGDPPCEVVLTP
jgi:hypothetical protein